MIIKTSRLKTFIKEYDAQIGTDYEWEDWDDTTTHIYGFDIETRQESLLLDKLHEKYNLTEYDS